MTGFNDVTAPTAVSAAKFPVPNTDAIDEQMVRYKDFSLKRKPIKFRIEDELFTANAAINVDLLESLATLAGSGFDVDSAGKDRSIVADLEKLIQFCNAVLDEESAPRFAKIARKLDLNEQILPLIHWLVEAYGLRPFAEPSLSSEPSSEETTGITSEDGVLVRASE